MRAAKTKKMSYLRTFKIVEFSTQFILKIVRGHLGPKMGPDGPNGPPVGGPPVGGPPVGGPRPLRPLGPLGPLGPLRALGALGALAGPWPQGPRAPLHCIAFHRLHSIPLHCIAFHRLHSNAFFVSVRW